MQIDKSTFKKLALLVALGVGLAWLLMNVQGALGILSTLWKILSPFVIGLIMAFLLNIPMSAIEKHVFRGRGGKLKRPLSFILTIIAVLGVLALVVFIVVPQLIKTTIMVGNMLTNVMPQLFTSIQQALLPYEEYIPQLQEYLNKLDWRTIDWGGLVGKVAAFLQSGAGSFFNTAVNVASSLFSGIFNFFIGIIFAAYVLLDKERLTLQSKGLLQAYMPEKRYSSFMRITSLIHRTFSQFVGGQCTESVVIGFIFCVVLWVSGFEYALMIGVLTGFLSLIPIFGTTIACIIGALLILMSQGWLRAIIFVALFLFIQQIDGNFIYPHIVGSSVGLPPMWVLVGVTLGGSLMGFVGMLIFIPLTSVVYSLLHQDATRRLEKKGIALASLRPPEDENPRAKKRTPPKPKAAASATSTSKKAKNKGKANKRKK